MSGRRRVQRSARTTVAVALLIAAAVLVAVAVAVGSSVGTVIAAVGSVLLGAIAVRVMYAEVVQTRLESARGRAAQARAFGAALAETAARHSADRARLTSRLVSSDAAIIELSGSIRVADARVGAAESLAAAQTALAHRERERADDAQGRLTALLDEVLAYQVPLEPVEADESPEATQSYSDDLPTVVDLIAWEERTSAATASGDVRKHA
jgi:hypothetical protein